MTQVELATKLGLTQSHLSEYERGGLRLHGSQLLVSLAQALDVSADELLGISAQKPAGRTSTRVDLRLLRRLQQIEQLPKRQKQYLLGTIDAVLKSAAVG